MNPIPLCRCGHGSSPTRPAGERTRGSALMVVLILAVVLVTILGALVSYIRSSAQLEKRSNLRLESTYAAEYSFEKAFHELNLAISQTNVPTITQTTAQTNLTTAPTDVFTSALGYTWKTYLTVPTEDGLVTGTFTSANPVSGTYHYLSIVEFQRTAAGLTAPVQLGLQREWIYTIQPLFKYAIFYDRDMELFPGAAFVAGGRVHSNGRIYTGTTASITFTDFVTDVNGLANQYSPLDPRTQGSLNGPLTYNRGPAITTSRLNPPGTLTADTTDANHNNDGARELIEIPVSYQSDPSSADRMYNKAGLKVLVNTTSSSVNADSGVTVPGNNRVFITQDGTVIPATDPLAVYLNGMFANGTMQDYRENASVTTTDVDVSKITTGYNNGGFPAAIPSTAKWPNDNTVPASLKNQNIPAALRGKALWNGIVYVADVTDSTSHPVGVKLVNGASLPNGNNASSPKAGLTFVSNNATYIVGDYNTGGSPPVDSGSNLAANNYAPGYTVEPAAVMADAVTVVSSNWVSGGYNSVSALNSRTPSNTTINSALISGIVPTSSSAYSGGVENYIRLLENWSNKRLTYYGSIINLYNSQQATAPWQTTGAYYNAPVRNWYFDSNFKDPNKLPPGTPVLRSISRGQWVQLQ